MTVQDPDSAQAHGRDVLVGERIRLRPLQERDLDPLERWWTDTEWQVFQQQTVRPQPTGHAADLFRVMGLHRIGLAVAAFNTRGRRAYENAGFEVEGVRREAVFLDGAFTDEVLMGVLQQDWEALEAARAAEVQP